MLYHVNPAWLPGGYLGVDVFFVISGFLITRLLIAERAGSGRISLRQFWIRRARRILSPLLPMLFATVAVTALVDRTMLHALRNEVLGAVTFTSNWVQISEHQSYFTRFGPPSLLQHLWSLAVEEQFYLVWPVLVIAVLCWWGRNTAVAIVAGAGALAAAAAMAVLYQPGTDPSPIYYSTATHSAGLFGGAVLAVVWPAVAARVGSSFGSSVLAGAGLAGIAIGYWLLDEDGSATYRGGILAVSAACALLISGLGLGRNSVERLLSRPSLCWLGARSYGLYLWHWPVLVLGDRLLGRRTLLVAGVEIAAAVLLAAASYRWIEKPVLRLGYRRAWQAGWCAVRGGRTGRIWVAGATAAGGVLVLGALVFAPAPPLTGLDKQLAEALAAQQAAAVAAPGAQPPAPVVDAPPASPAATESVGPPPGDQISAVGDSVMLASSFALRDRLPSIRIDAVTNRSMQAAPGILSALDAGGALRPVVLLGLGSNGSFPRDLLEGIVDELGPERKLFLVNLYLQDRPWTDEVNRTLTEVALAHRANVRLIDWQSAVSGHEDLLYADHVHPQPGAGADLYAQTVIAAMSEKPAPPAAPAAALDPVVPPVGRAPAPPTPTPASRTPDHSEQLLLTLVALAMVLAIPILVAVRAAVGTRRVQLAVAGDDRAAASDALFAPPTRARSPPRATADTTPVRTSEFVTTAHHPDRSEDVYPDHHRRDRSMPGCRRRGRLLLADGLRQTRQDHRGRRQHRQSVCHPTFRRPRHGDRRRDRDRTGATYRAVHGSRVRRPGHRVGVAGRPGRQRRRLGTRRVGAHHSLHARGFGCGRA